MTTKSSYQNLIEECDKTCGFLRKHWLESLVENKDDWMQRINAVLDERLRLMKLRDMATALQPS